MRASVRCRIVTMTKWDIGRYAIDRVEPYEESYDRPERLAALLALHEERLEPWCLRLRLRLERDAEGLLVFVELEPKTQWQRVNPAIGVGLIAVALLDWMLSGSFNSWLIWIAVVFFAAGLISFSRDFYRFRVDALVYRRCASCRYDLSACPPAIDPQRFGHWNVGPRLCPECGALWPLVPGSFHD